MTHCALVVVDVQNDFCPGGSLAVADGDKVAAGITKHIERYGDGYDFIIATRDWHMDPGDHFAKDKDPNYKTTWPSHCVAGTYGADFHNNLKLPPDTEHVFKGQFEAAYSGFEGVTSDLVPVTLNELLQSEGVEELDVCGIATDYCVLATCLDAVKLGYKVRLLKNLVAGVDPKSTEDAITAMALKGVDILE